jgi:galactoside O-acetyltransferase
MTSFYSREELELLKFKSLGENVLLSRNASIYSPEKINISNNVRIDDFCIISGNINIGNYVHIAAGCYLFGEHGIILEDFSAISSRSALYSGTDDYTGEFLSNPMCPILCRKITKGPIFLGKHVLIGTGTTILPGVYIGEGTSVGAMSLVNRSLKEWKIYKGIPAREYKERLRGCSEFEELLFKK